MPQSRQLAAIMFTDIIGYTALMGNDEQKAFDLLNKNRNIQKPIIKEFNGKWIKEMGDGAIATFPTASDALRAAVKIHEHTGEINEFQLSIGIHLGEVVFEDEDVFGDGVNLASRIEAMAIGNSILVSKPIRDQVKNNSDFSFKLLGSFTFKNVSEPIEVYALGNKGLVVPSNLKTKNLSNRKTNKRNISLITGIGLFLLIFAAYFGQKYLMNNNSNHENQIPIKQKLLAILPFENPQKDSSLYFLSDGIPEDLINRLSAFSGIKVFARSATFSLPDSLSSVTSLRRLLNADMVLSGQILKRGNEYVLNCELIDAINQSQLWGKKFGLGSLDISQIEDSLILELMEPLEIAPGNHVESNKKDQVDPAAYTEYLKGRHLTYGSTPEESERALAHFREAIKIDPGYAQAYAAIANEKVVQNLFATASKKEIVNEARISLEAAKALDPGLADIYMTEGALKFYYDWDWEGAVASYKKALELDPGNATIYIRYSATLADIGNHEEALTLADKAIELDPISISSLHNLGWVNLLANNFELSADAFGRLLELYPNWAWGHIKKAYAHVFMEEFDLALYHGERAEQLFKDGWGSELLQVALIFIYKSCGENLKEKALADRFMKYARENTMEDPWNLSYLYYMQGDFIKSIEWEEKVVKGRYPLAYQLNLRLFYDADYYNSPEHQEILRKMGFVK
jgi:TolB-like protein/lipoprotein NlpI